MDSPEEITSPLIDANTPDNLPEERPCTPELDLDVPEPYKPSSPTAPGSSYEPPSSPITLPTFTGDMDDGEAGGSGATSDKPKDDITNNPMFDLPDNLSDTEEQTQGQIQRSGLITDIFGDSDSDEEEQEEKKDDEAQSGTTAELEAQKAQKKKDDDDVDTDEELEMLNKNDKLFVNDFELMMERKKQERRRNMSRRKKEVTDIINSADDRIIFMITQMKEAAEEDKRLNQAGQAAVNKLAMLKSVMTQLNKHDLQNAFIDCGILPVIAEWLSPLPDNSLPHITIRTSFLNLLQTYPQINTDMLKDSKLGRVVMGLYKNHKELWSNRETARRLIHNWARPIFGLNSDYTALSREDRVDADLRHMVKSRKRRRQSKDEPKPESDKPGDKNFIMRARVPVPSNTDYVIRPRSKIEDEVTKRVMKLSPKIEKLNQTIANKKKMANPKNLRTSTVCLTGNKMPL